MNPRSADDLVECRFKRQVRFGPIAGDPQIWLADDATEWFWNDKNHLGTVPCGSFGR